MMIFIFEKKKTKTTTMYSEALLHTATILFFFRFLRMSLALARQLIDNLTLFGHQYRKFLNHVMWNLWLRKHRVFIVMWRNARLPFSHGTTENRMIENNMICATVRLLS